MNFFKRKPVSSPARSRPSGRRHTFRRHPEALEDRTVPAVSVGIDPANAGTLLITGDAAANEVTITYKEGQLLNNLSVESANGTDTFISLGIDTIRVDLKG